MLVAEDGLPFHQIFDGQEVPGLQVFDLTEINVLRQANAENLLAAGGAAMDLADVTGDLSDVFTMRFGHDWPPWLWCNDARGRVRKVPRLPNFSKIHFLFSKFLFLEIQRKGVESCKRQLSTLELLRTISTRHRPRREPLRRARRGKQPRRVSVAWFPPGPPVLPPARFRAGGVGGPPPDLF